MKSLIGAAAFFLMSIPSISNALTLECKVPESGAGGGYITQLYVFEYNEATGKALAADGWIMHYHDAPIPAKVSDETSKKLVLSWTIQMSDGTKQLTKMQYRASYFKDTKQITVRAVPGGGYSNTFEGRGKCKEI